MTATIDVFMMPQVVTLTLGGDTGASLMNYPVNRTDFNLTKGVTNEILFFVKDVDRHPVTADNLANLGITDIRIIITGPDEECQQGFDHLYLGSHTPPVVQTYTTTVGTTTVTYSNSMVSTTNTVTVTTTSNSSGSNAVVTNATVLMVLPGAGTYTGPELINSIVVETWGPGGVGLNGPNRGAGSGAYAKKTFSISPGDQFDYYIGNSTAPEEATFWGNSVDANSAIFGAYGGGWVDNNVTNLYPQLSSPFGDYDVGYYGDLANTANTFGRASAWSGGNASTNPTGLNLSNVEGGGPSSAIKGMTPGGGAPAGSGQIVPGGYGQIRITEYYDVSNGTVTSNSNVTTNAVTIINSVTNSVTYTNTTVTSGGPSVLVPAPGINPAKGVWMLKLKATDIYDWPLGYMRYTIICDRVGGDQVVLYTDRGYGPYGLLRVLPGPFPAPREAVTITPADMIYIDNTTVMGPQYLQSGAYMGAAQVGNLTGLQGIVVHMEGFKGYISVEATLENQPSQTDSDWFAANITNTMAGTIANGTVTFDTPTNGPVYMSIEGNYTWVRFKVSNTIDTPNTFTSIDYRAD
jgi:hypothetical protein